MTKMRWPVKITGKTRTQSGRPRAVSATVDGAGDAAGAVLRYMLTRKNAWQWYGDAVHCITPLGQRFSVLVEPANG